MSFCIASAGQTYHLGNSAGTERERRFEQTMERQELLRMRKAMKLTQAQMANLLRLPLKTIKKLEAGTLDKPTRTKLVRALIARDFWLSK